MSIAKLKRRQDEFLAAIGTDRHDSSKLRLMATTNAILPLLVDVATTAELMRSLQKRGARDPNDLAMIAAAADKFDRAIAKLEGGYCGGHIPLGPDASNLCNGCGRSLYCKESIPPVYSIGDSELVSMRDEAARLRKENEELKKRERDRWASAASAFGDRYSTVSDQWNNTPMNVGDLGTLRPGDF